MKPNHKSPTEAVFGLIDAYKSLEIDEIVRNKDFELDSQIFWENSGLPVTDEQKDESTVAFETNFRGQLAEGMPDYREVDFISSTEECLEDDFAVVTVVGRTPQNDEFELRIPTVCRDSKWIAVLHPGYDHL